MLRPRLPYMVRDTAYSRRCKLALTLLRARHGASPVMPVAPLEVDAGTRDIHPSQEPSKQDGAAQKRSAKSNEHIVTRHAPCSMLCSALLHSPRHSRVLSFAFSLQGKSRRSVYRSAEPPEHKAAVAVTRRRASDTSTTMHAIDPEPAAGSSRLPVHPLS